jgi:hypothetical protein
MIGLLVLAVIAFVVITCVRAVLSARLLERDSEKWRMLQQAEQERHLRRQELIGSAVLQGVRFVSSFMKKKEEDR